MASRILLLLLLLPFCALAQRSRISLLVNTTAGNDFTLKGFSSGNKVRDLIYFDNSTPYLRLSASLFFGEKFGLTFAYHGSLNSQKDYRGFKTMIEQNYPDYYNYVPGKNKYEQSVNGKNAGKVTSRILTGITYNFEYKKFNFTPKLLTGFMLLDDSEAEVYLKKKNSNEYIHQVYKQETEAGTAVFCLNAGFNFIWRVNKGLGINLELNYFENWVTEGAFVYNVTTTNSYTGTETVETLQYTEKLRQLSIGAGICYYFRKTPVKNITTIE
jgi:hypothetical protein